jgi:uncharacterized protein with von Willebrand factor type A (vWA) domain
MAETPANLPSPSVAPLGGIIHTYQKYDPKNFPSPTAPPPDLASAAFEHMLRYGSTRRLTDEELARAVKIDPSQIAGLGPSLESLIQMLQERKERILATYETDRVQKEAARAIADQAAATPPPPTMSPKAAARYQKSVQEEQIRELEQLWYQVGNDQDPFAKSLHKLMERLGEKYQVEDLVSKYAFKGREPLTVPEALAVKEELETIDRLLEQLKEAMKNAQIAVIDLDELSRFVEEADVEDLSELQQQVAEYIRQQAEMQGLEATRQGYNLTPKAFKTFQSKLLQEIFDDLQAARSGRHKGPIFGEGAVELPVTKPYEFGDSAANMDVAASFVNAMVREAGARQSHGSGTSPSHRITVSPSHAPPPRIALRSEDIEIHRTRNNPKCATAVLMDMSGSMRHDGQYVNVKRMALALDGLIRSEYPGDFLAFFEVYSFAKRRHISEIPALLPKPVTIHKPMVRLKADMSDPKMSEAIIPPHFTNIQHGLRLARQLLAVQNTPNRQIIILTDGLPTAHFQGESLFLLYPPDPATEEATMREGALCKKDGITINLFMLPSWWQSSEDIGFAHRLAERTGGRVFFTGGGDVDRFVLWDYVNHRRKIIG